MCQRERERQIVGGRMKVDRTDRVVRELHGMSCCQLVKQAAVLDLGLVDRGERALKYVAVPLRVERERVSEPTLPPFLRSGVVGRLTPATCSRSRNLP